MLQKISAGCGTHIEMNLSRSTQQPVISSQFLLILTGKHLSSNSTTHPRPPPFEWADVGRAPSTVKKKKKNEEEEGGRLSRDCRLRQQSPHHHQRGCRVYRLLGLVYNKLVTYSRPAGLFFHSQSRAPRKKSSFFFLPSYSLTIGLYLMYPDVD